MSALFSPFKLKDVTLGNRIAVAPKCQYMANEGLYHGLASYPSRLTRHRRSRTNHRRVHGGSSGSPSPPVPGRVMIT